MSQISFQLAQEAERENLIEMEVTKVGSMILPGESDSAGHFGSQKWGCNYVCDQCMNVEKFNDLNIKNSKSKALWAPRDQGLSTVTANPSEFGLKGVNSPLL